MTTSQLMTAFPGIAIIGNSFPSKGVIGVNDQLHLGKVER